MAAKANLALTLTNWQIGNLIHTVVSAEFAGAQAEEVVASLGQQLGWTHFKAPIPVYSDEARAFCIQQALDARLSIRALCELIGRQGFERGEIANAQTPGGSAVPLDAFGDPYFLDFLGLEDILFATLSAPRSPSSGRCR